MKCFVLCHAYPGSGFMAGGETTLHDLNVELVNDGWQVEVALSEKKTDGTEHDYVIDGVQVRAYRDQHQAINLARRADLLFGHLGQCHRLSLIGRQLKKPVVHLVHNDLDYTKGIARIATYMVYNTDWVLESFRKSATVRPPGVVVHPPVNPEKYKVRSKRKYITLVNLADGDKGPYSKGPDVFYEMAKRFPNEQFLGVRGSYGSQDIREMDNVTIVPNIDDIREYYRETKLVISPSNYESYGRISIEAAASGIPSVTSLAPGFREHGMAARMVDYRDYDGWETAIAEVLGNYKSECKTAREKSAALWQKTEGELQVFCGDMRSLIRK